MATFLVRIELPDRPGALGAVASRIGAVRGDVVSIEIIRRQDGRAVDEFVVELAEPSWTPPAQGTPLPEVVEALARLLPPDVLPTALDATRPYAVSAINAAVVDPSGAVVLIVSLMGFPGPLTGTEVEAAGLRLRAATATVTAALAGNSG